MPRHACLRLALLSLMVIVGACAAPPDGPARNDFERADFEKADFEKAGQEKAGQEKVDYEDAAHHEPDKALIDWMFDGLIHSALDRDRQALKTKRPPDAPPALPSGSPGDLPGGTLSGESVQGESTGAREMQRLIDMMTNPDMPRPRVPR